MPKYRLNLNFSEQDLETIYTCGQHLVIVKHTGERDSNVAWVSFKPFEQNVVDWETEFSVYASTSSVQGGAKIRKLSDRTAQCQIQYDFDKGYFRDMKPMPEIGPNSYAIINSMADEKFLTFGLAQSVSINGKTQVNNPINAVLVPSKNTLVMTPIERIDVFLEANIDSATILSRVNSQKIRLEYSGSVDEITIKFDPKLGGFCPENA